MTRKLAERFLGALAFALAWAASAAVQTVVVGTGDPDIDVPAVQAAVDQGGEVILRGHFSFARPPTVTPSVDGFPQAMVRVSRSVVISGAADKNGEIPRIDGGQIPFYVDAPGSSVTIQSLRFLRPTAEAILMNAVHGAVVSSCKIESIEPFPVFGSTGIDISTTPGEPTPTRPGTPENISGTILIVNNDIDVAGGSADTLTLGVVMFSVGQSPDREVDVYVSGNNIKNTTEPAINMRRVGGRAYVEGNVITTGAIVGPPSSPQAIRVANIGSYLIAHNSIDCGWAHPQAQGIGVFSQIEEWPMERAIVVDNDVTMSPPEGTVFGDQSAGIGIRGFTHGNVVMDNRIRGRARAALSVFGFFQGAIPANNTFVLNRFDDFEPSLADVFVGEGVINTLIVGPGTIEDHGVGTVIVPLP